MNRRPLVRRARRRPFPLQFEAMESRLLLATFLVDNTNDSGSGSLRQAIDSANATAGFNIIDFDINSTGMPVIAPASPLPEITNPVLIYGISQPGSHLVEISGAGAGPGVDGLWISAGNSGVAGLAIVKFGGSGIRLTTHGGNIIVADQIGTDPSGASGLGNMGDAVTIVARPATRSTEPSSRIAAGAVSPSRGPVRRAMLWRGTTSAPTPPAPSCLTRATASRSAGRLTTRSAAPPPGPATSFRTTSVTVS